MHFIQTPQEAEANAAVRMRELGFSDAQVTVGGADGGIDVQASTALAQVKWRGGMVGRPEVQALFGARGSNFSKQLIFFAASDYSQHAVEYADHAQIALFVYEPTGTLTAKNRLAEQLLRARLSSPTGVNVHSGLPLYESRSKKGFWRRVVLPFLRYVVYPFLRNVVYPFLRVHWRIVGALCFTVGIVVGVPIAVSPDPGQDRIDGVVIAVACTIGAPIFWWLYLTDRARKQRREGGGGDYVATPPP